MQRAILVTLVWSALMTYCLDSAAANIGFIEFSSRLAFAQQNPPRRHDQGSRPNDNAAQAAPQTPQPQDIRPQGDLREDIYNHLREQRNAPPREPKSNRNDRSH